jgi:6-phosphogluconate dehydrogenase (decarboxylating)
MGMIGLGRIGANMVRRLREGQEWVVFDISPKATWGPSEANKVVSPTGLAQSKAEWTGEQLE